MLMLKSIVIGISVLVVLSVTGVNGQHIARAGIRVNTATRSMAELFNNTEQTTASLPERAQIRVKPSLSLSPQKHVISLSNLLPQNRPDSAAGGTSMSQPNIPWKDMNQVETRVMHQKVDISQEVPPNTSQDNVRKLRRILAGKLDPDWTSDMQPRVLRQRGVSTPNNPVNANSDLFKETHSLNITLKDKDGLPYAVSDNELHSFREWLVERATCEMEYVWDDLGAHFWPRWIRRGVCIDKPGQSCSWPPGMKCRPSGSRALQLLHWKCEDAKNPDTKKRAFGEDDLPIPGRLGLRRNRRQAYPYNQSRFWPTANLWSGPRQATSANGINSNDAKKRNTRAGRWRAQRASLSPEERELIRQRRAKRLIRQLSVEDKGLLCYWQTQKYLVSDTCNCSCG